MGRYLLLLVVVLAVFQDLCEYLRFTIVFVLVLRSSVSVGIEVSKGVLPRVLLCVSLPVYLHYCVCYFKG